MSLGQILARYGSFVLAGAFLVFMLTDEYIQFLFRNAEAFQIGTITVGLVVIIFGGDKIRQIC